MYRLLAIAVLTFFSLAAVAQEADDPELIFKKTTVWRLLSPDAKLATYAIDDPVVDGVACHFTVPEIGGWAGWAGFAEERSETSLACRQVGPIRQITRCQDGEVPARSIGQSKLKQASAQAGGIGHINPGTMRPVI